MLICLGLTALGVNYGDQVGLIHFWLSFFLLIFILIVNKRDFYCLITWKWKPYNQKYVLLYIAFTLY